MFDPVRAAVVADQLYRALTLARPRFDFDVSTPAGFDAAISDLAKRWARTGNLSNPRMVSRALLSLRVDWAALTAKQRAALIERAAGMVQLPLGVQKAIAADMGLSSKAIYKATLEGLGDEGLKVKATFRHYDKRVARTVAGSSAHFVSENGVPQEAFSRVARAEVEAGVKQGLGRAAIAANLRRSVGATMEAINDSYWTTVASAFVGRGRSYSQLAGYHSAGVDRYLILSVLDERTTETCRFLDGRTFEVARSVSAFEAEERITQRSPEAVKVTSPWVRERMGPDGRTELYVNRPGGRMRSVARVDRPGYGTTNPGTYLPPRGMDSHRSSASLQNMGLSWPPYHGHCRTTTVPDL